MILAIDHVAYTSNSINQDIDIFTQNGYTIDFDVKNIPNPEIKKELMTDYSEIHDLMLLKKTNSYSIEILNHKNSFSNNSFIKNSINSINSIDTLQIETTNFEKSLEFWRSFGYNEENNLLVFNSIFQSSKLYLSLNETDTANKTTLDTTGFNCIAFITNNINRECKRLNSLGYQTTSLNNISFNNKNMTVAFVISDQKEIVELIEVKNIRTISKKRD